MLKRSSFLIVCLLFVASCATIKAVVPKAPSCYLEAGKYRMVYELMSAQNCLRIPPKLFMSTIDFGANQVTCGMKILPFKGGQAILRFEKDLFLGKLGASDGKCTVIYSVVGAKETSK